MDILSTRNLLCREFATVCQKIATFYPAANQRCLCSRYVFYLFMSRDKFYAHYLFT